jgi:hypothetical protein
MVRGIVERATGAVVAFTRLACTKNVVRGCAAAVALTVAGSASANTQWWNGYYWARTGLLTIGLGNNLSTTWQPFLRNVATQWSADPVIDLVVVAGKTAPLACKPSYGGIQVCNANYGATGWLGYANVWANNGQILQATVRLNEHYFGMAKYNTAAWRAKVICEEIGHTLGLDHTNTVKTDLNTGSCMDYTNDPSGTKGTNGTLANTAPNAVDFAALANIYSKVNTSQLSTTKPTYFSGSSSAVGDDVMFEHRSMVPEPATWAMMIIGFGAIGAMVRRRPVAAAA